MAIENRLENKIAIVTGGAQGIGRAVAERFAREGANVVIADVNEEEGEAVRAADIGPGKIHFVHCNVMETLDIHNLVAATLDMFENIDILVNNAAIISSADFLEIEESEFDKVLSVNLRGAFLCGQSVARRMVEQVENGREPGSIINMTSINTVVAIANQVPYCVAKGGLTQLTKVMALSLAKYGIRTNAIGPGSIMTKILESVSGDKETMERIYSRTPLGRIGEPAEIASIAAFLASNDASYITGETIFADGGRMALNYTVPVPK
ncbi:MAG: SDR family NAD(P)-dependent oxidoreductase [Rhizobiaceae bacterium]